jgi:hypothetical protein
VLWLLVLRNYAHCLVWFTCVLSIGISVAFCILCISRVLYGAAVLFAIMAALQTIYFWCIQDRIAFAAATLEVVSGFVQEFTSTLYCSFGFILVQCAWVFVWLICAYSTTQVMANNNTVRLHDLAGVFFYFFHAAFL